MAFCFVIQPFDRGKYDKRFEDIYKPAIIATGLEAYRVDRDPSVEVPIDAIEDQIRQAAVCLADITTDNPNVWYELGFAFAVSRPVIMVCSDERPGKKYPFDIQHRKVIDYLADSPRDFEKLQKSIIETITALLNKKETLRQIVETEQVAPVQGLGQSDLAVFAVLAGSVYPPEGSAGLWTAKNEVERAGFTSIAFSLGIRRLHSNGLIELVEEEDHRGEVYKAARITEKGWAWIDANEELFTIRRPTKKDELDDKIPF